MDERRARIADFVRQAAVDRVGFHHQGRCVGPGGAVDCVGLVVLAERAAGLHVDDEVAYAASARTEFLRPKLAIAHERLPAGGLRRPEGGERQGGGGRQVGDVVLWDLRGDPHVGILLGMVEDGREMVGHAYRSRGRVVVHALAGAWILHLDSVWRHRDLGA